MSELLAGSRSPHGSASLSGKGQERAEEELSTPLDWDESDGDDLHLAGGTDRDCEEDDCERLACL
jgi:hypothetical protein